MLFYSTQTKLSINMKTFPFLLFCLLFHFAQSQTYSVVADSLRLPVGVEVDAQGRVWVTESGYGFNDGAVSLVQPDGSVWPVIVGLPSFFDTTTQEGIGPWHTLTLPNNQLAVTVGATGQVVFFDLTGFTPGVSAPLTLANSTWALEIGVFVLGQGIPETDPYSVAADAAGNLYVADAAANAIIKAKPSGQLSVFATFPGYTNPLPFGPPVVDAVPTRIISKPGGGFYVCQLTGFPFLDGMSNIYDVDSNGVVSIYASGLTQLTDLQLDAYTGDLYALQIGQFVLDPLLPPGYAPNSSLVTRIKTNGDRSVVAQNFELSAGMALDGQGNLYTSELGSGRLLKWDNVTTATREHNHPDIALSIAPNPTAGDTRISFFLPSASSVQMRVLDVAGKAVFLQDLGRLDSGAQQMEWQAEKRNPGMYWVEIQTELGRSVQPVVVGF